MAKKKDETEQATPITATGETGARANSAAPAPSAPAKEELVPIRLFKDNERYKDDVFVAVNGRSFQIRRGETVMVPGYVAAVLEQSMDQDASTAKLMSQESAQFEAQAKALDV